MNVLGLISQLIGIETLRLTYLTPNLFVFMVFFFFAKNMKNVIILGFGQNVIDHYTL